MQNRHRSIKFSMVFAPLFALCITAMGALLHLDTERQRRTISSNEERLVNVLARLLRDELVKVQGDLLFLSQQRLLADFVHGQSQLQPFLAHEYKRFAVRRGVYDQIRFIGAHGREVVRVNYRDGEGTIVPDSELQNKSDRYYFRETIHLKPGQMYVSPFDLNVENGLIETPRKPMIRFGMPITDLDGQPAGALIVNFVGTRLLSIVDRIAQSSYGEVWLLNGRGYWIVGPTPESEWGFMYDDLRDETLRSRDSELWTRLNREKSPGFFNRGDMITRARLCGLRDCADNGSDESSFVFPIPFDTPDLPWEVVSFVPSEMVSGLGLLSPRRRPLLPFVGILGLITIVIGFVAWRLTQTVESLTAKEQELGQSREQFRRLIEAAPDAIVISDANGRIRLANQRAEDCFGYHSDALLAMSVDDLVPSEARTKHVSQRESYMKHPTIKTVRSIFDMRGRRSDGTEFPVEVNLAPATMGDETLVISIIRDYSDHRELEAQLRQSQKMEAIGQLTGGMAHDFNNLLGVIIGNLDLASRNVDEDSPARKRLETAKRAAKRGADLTRRMLAVARRQSLKPQPASINHVIEEISEILPRTLGPSVELVVKLQEQLPAVMVDQSEFENALLNLAINARDAMPQGGKLYIRTELATLGDDYLPVRNNEIPPGVYARISITDTGVGMTSEIMSRVFEPFYTTKEGGKGTGLGLAMIYGFIKQSRGNIRIYSEPGQGTTVNVYLPTTEQPVIAPEHVSAPVSNGIHGKESILVVDDEVELLEVAVTYLEELGYTVHPATDGNSALEMLDAHPSIDLLLTDVVMPGGMNGVALAKEVRKRSPRTKVLYTSGFPSNVLADKSEIKIDAPLIGKPYQKPDLAARVRDVLDNGNG